MTRHESDEPGVLPSGAFMREYQFPDLPRILAPMPFAQLCSTFTESVISVTDFESAKSESESYETRVRRKPHSIGVGIR